MTQIKALDNSKSNQGVKTELDPRLVLLMKEEVGRAKSKKLPVIRAFEAIAEKSGLKVNTVRNYYYRYIHEQEVEINKRGNSIHPGDRAKEMIGKSFAKEEVRELMIEMLKAQARGESVRSCANRLAGGDPRLLLRYQNKYRNMIAREPEYVKALMKEMDENYISYYNPIERKLVKAAGSRLKPCPDRDEFIELIGDAVSNLIEIDNISLKAFFGGLRDLSNMAASYRRYEEGSRKGINESDKLKEQLDKTRDELKEKEHIIQETRARLMTCEARLEEQRKRTARLMSIFHQMAAVNRKFLKLSSTAKISGLADYVREIEDCIYNYDCISME